MTPNERAQLRDLVDRVRRQVAGVAREPSNGVCAYPRCGKAFEPSKHAPWQRYCSAQCRGSDWHRQHPEFQRTYSRTRRQRRREAAA